jgi:hypothetical protein
MIRREATRQPDHREIVTTGPLQLTARSYLQQHPVKPDAQQQRRAINSGALPSTHADESPVPSMATHLPDRGSTVLHASKEPSLQAKAETNKSHYSRAQVQEKPSEKVRKINTTIQQQPKQTRLNAAPLSPKSGEVLRQSVYACGVVWPKCLPRQRYFFPEQFGML